MPIQPINIITEEASKEDLINELAKLQKTLRYLLTGGLDTDNVNELNANVLNAGVVNSNLVTIRSELTGSSFIQIDGNGIRASDGTINTFEIDVNGNAYFSGDITASNITGSSITSGSTINVETDATIGNKLFLDANNFGNGISWGTIGDMEIYIDSAAKAMYIEAPGGIFANGTQIG